VTVTIMLPAPPAPHLGARPLPATPDAACGRCRRYRAMAIGFGGMTATKALKHFQINLTDVLVFLSRLTAQATSHVITPTSHMAEVVTATALTATLVVYIALSATATVQYVKPVAAQAHLRWTSRTFSGPSVAVTAVKSRCGSASDATASEVFHCRQRARISIGAHENATAQSDSICYRASRRTVEGRW